MPVIDLPILPFRDDTPQPDVEVGIINSGHDHSVSKTPVSFSDNPNSDNIDFIADERNTHITLRTTEMKRHCDLHADNADGDNVDNIETSITHATILRIKSDNISNEKRLDNLLELIDLNHLRTDETNKVITLIRNHHG